MLDWALGLIREQSQFTATGHLSQHHIHAFGEGTFLQHVLNYSSLLYFTLSVFKPFWIRNLSRNC